MAAKSTLSQKDAFSGGGGGGKDGENPKGIPT